MYLSIYCHYLKKQYNINISVQELTSKTDRILPDFVIDAINKMDAFFEDFEKYVEIQDSISHPKNIFDYLKNEALKHGELVYNDEPRVTGYQQHDNVHRIAIIDNLSNLDTEKGEEERANMVNFCRHYVRKLLCNFFDFTVIQVMQMSFDKERQQFTTNGQSIVSKLEPSLDGIGEAKVIARSMHVIFGLFNPSRYEMINYPNADGYRIDILQNRFRALNVIKCNDSDVGMRIGLYFEATSENFWELPSTKDKDALDKVYTHVKGIILNPEEKEKNLFN